MSRACKNAPDESLDDRMDYALHRNDKQRVLEMLQNGYKPVTRHIQMLLFNDMRDMFDIFARFEFHMDAACLYGVIIYDRDEMFRELMLRKCPMDANCLMYAIAHDRDEMFSALMNAKCPMDADCFRVAVGKNRIAMIKALCAAGCPEE